MKLFWLVIGITVKSSSLPNLSVVLVSFNNLYHCTSSLLMLLSNTQVNDVVDLPSHTVTSSGSLITVVDINIAFSYVHTYIHTYICVCVCVCVYVCVWRGMEKGTYRLLQISWFCNMYSGICIIKWKNLQFQFLSYRSVFPCPLTYI